VTGKRRQENKRRRYRRIKDDVKGKNKIKLVTSFEDKYEKL
jgi:hypothetical protein